MVNSSLLSCEGFVMSAIGYCEVCGKILEVPSVLKKKDVKKLDIYDQLALLGTNPHYICKDCIKLYLKGEKR